MVKVIVSILFEGGNQLRDFEVPNNLTIRELLEKLKLAFPEMRSQGEDVGFQVIVASENRVLGNNETLLEAGIWDGAILLIHPYKVLKRREKQAEEKPSPLLGWKALNTFYGAQKPSRSRSSTKFVWKRLD